MMRTAAVLFGLSLFVMAEGICWLFGWGEPNMQEDPFVGFNSLQPLFVLDQEKDQYHIAPARLKFFVEDSFPAKNRPGTYRIFCLGGSTVQGRPFAKETSFTTWLQLALTCADPSRKWEVVNCGGVSYASYRLVPVMLECMQYQPDLFIVCTGHNEFLEDRTYGDIRDTPALLAIPHHYLTRLRSYQLYRRLLLSLANRRAPPRSPVTLGSDVDAMLDYHNGIRAYHRDLAWRRGVVQHFQYNLSRMADICQQHKVPLVLIVPPSNLADTLPFKSEHRGDITAAQLAQFNQLVKAARETSGIGHQLAIEAYRKALAIDSTYAGTHYELGLLLELIGRYKDARDEFLAAREQDVCPLRIIHPMEKIIQDVAADWSLPILDARRLLAAHTEHGILDGSVLVDHVHPSIESHKLIGLALVDVLAGMRVVVPPSGWVARARQVFQQHFESLPMFYFVRGQQRLHALQQWASGNADGPPVESRFPQRAAPQDDPLSGANAAKTNGESSEQ